jgi:hypothetical protein
MRQMEYVSCMVLMLNAYEILVGIAERMPLRNFKQIGNNIKTDIRVIDDKNVNWIHLAQDTVQS